MSDFDEAHNINLKDYITSNFSGKVRKINNNDFRFNPCLICGHEDCFTVYNSQAKFHCFSCGAKGDIIDLLILSGKAKDTKEAFEQLGIKSDFVSKVKDTFQGTVKAISGDVVKGLNTAPVKEEGKSLLSHESPLKSKPLTERIREQIANSKKESNQVPSSLSESAKTEPTEQAVEPAKEKAVENQVSSLPDKITEDPFKIEPSKNVVTLGTTQQLTDNQDYFHSRGLSDSIIEKYALKIDGDVAFLPCGIRRSLTAKSSSDRYKNPCGSVQFFNLDYLQKSNEVIFVTEGIFDALALEEIGYKAISLNSSSNVNKFTEHLDNFSSLLVSAFDNDEAGQKATEELRQVCKEKGIVCLTLPIKKGKDINEWLLSDKDSLVSSLSELLNYPNSSQSFDKLLNQQRKEYIPSGIAPLDYALGGGLVPDLYIIGGVPASGKSAFALQVAQGISESGRAVLYCSTELSENEVASRNVSRISYQSNKEKYLSALEVNTGNLTLEKRQLFSSLSEIFKAKMRNFYFSKKHISSVQDIVSESTYFSIIKKENPIVIVDYLQNLKGTEKQTEKQAIDCAITELKKLSNSLNIPIIVVSSLNRDGYSNSSMSSFKESGSIEYSAAIAITLKPSKDGENQLKARKENPKRKDLASIETEIDIVKNRHFMPQSIKLNFNGSGNNFDIAS